MALGAGQLKSKKPTLRREEDAIQRNLVQYLPYMLPRPHVLFAVPNGGKRSPVEASIMKGLGVKPGVHDLVLLWDRRAFLMEVKASNGVLSPKQVEVHEEVVLTGCPSGVVRSLQDAIAFLRECGIPLTLKDGA